MTRYVRYPVPTCSSYDTETAVCLVETACRESILGIRSKSDISQNFCMLKTDGKVGGGLFSAAASVRVSGAGFRSGNGSSMIPKCRFSCNQLDI
jgi:hypothetical protein